MIFSMTELKNYLFSQEGKMFDLDIIMLTNTKDDNIYKMTCKAIDSLRKSEESSFNLILVESNKNSDYEYDAEHYIKPDIDFNYNSYLNIGSKYCVSDYSAISNNDVVFHNKWWTNLKTAMIKNNLDTASPKSPTKQFGVHDLVEMKHRYTPETKIVEGHYVVYTFCGWFWAMTKDVREWLFPLDEQFSFFYQDNDIIMRLQEKNCKHALVGGSKVSHIGQRSHDILINNGSYYKHTAGLRTVFEKKYKDRLNDKTPY